ncbi:glycosyltransferase family 25 protein [Halomonas sp. NPDC076908]|uniref:glycosyltransferase family 25 protein n=1 Tax=Halomonas sp. NPDC076908 TaxID=3390567 RepID=UPI003D0667FE
MKASEINENRDAFYNKVKELVRSEGVAQSIHFIEGYRGKINPRVFLQSGIMAYRFSDVGSEEELKFAESVACDNPGDIYIKLILANTLFSMGGVERAKNLLLSHCEEYEIKSFKSRVVSTLLNMGFYHDAHRVFEGLGIIADNKEHKILESRIKKSLSSGYFDHGSSLGVLYISLDRDVRKQKVITGVYDNVGLSPVRLPAVLGSSLPRVVRGRVDPMGMFDDALGSLGCALSHVRAWESAVSNDFTLITEDDGLPFYDFSDDIYYYLSNNQELDVLFVNERMSSVRDDAFGLGVEGLMPVSKRLKNLPDTQKGWGGDGYVLSRKGAERLLEAFEKDNICGHIDGHLGSYGVCNNIDPESRAQKTAKIFRRRFLSGLVLDARALNFPMIHQMNFGFSSRDSY